MQQHKRTINKTYAVRYVHHDRLPQLHSLIWNNKHARQRMTWQMNELRHEHQWKFKVDKHKTKSELKWKSLDQCGYSRSWSDPSSFLPSSRLFMKGNRLLNEKFFFLRSNVEVYKEMNHWNDFNNWFRFQLLCRQRSLGFDILETSRFGHVLAAFAPIYALMAQCQYFLLRHRRRHGELATTRRLTRLWRVECRHAWTEARAVGWSNVSKWFKYWKLI